METRAVKRLFIIMLLVLLGGCSRTPFKHEKAVIGMPFQDLKAAYSDLRQVEDGKDSGILVFQRSWHGNIQKEQYYIRDNKLVGILVLFSKGTSFDSVVKKLIESNGSPQKSLNIMGAQIASWKRGKNTINLVSGTTATKLELPNGKSSMMQPGEVLLVIDGK